MIVIGHNYYYEGNVANKNKKYSNTEGGSSTDIKHKGNNENGSPSNNDICK